MVTPLLQVSVGHSWGVKCWTPKTLQHQIVRRVARSGECAYIRGECVHTRWVRIVVLLYATSPRATWPLFGVWEKRGEESCCSPGICPSYLSAVIVCLYRSTAVGCHIVCLLCEKRNGGGKSLTGIGVDSDDMCRHCLDNMEHPLTRQDVCIRNSVRRWASDVTLPHCHRWIRGRGG